MALLFQLNSKGFFSRTWIYQMWICNARYLGRIPRTLSMTATLSSTDSGTLLGSNLKWEVWRQAQIGPKKYTYMEALGPRPFGIETWQTKIRQVCNCGLTFTGRSCFCSNGLHMAHHDGLPLVWGIYLTINLLTAYQRSVTMVRPTQISLLFLGLASLSLADHYNNTVYVCLRIISPTASHSSHLCS